MSEPVLKIEGLTIHRGGSIIFQDIDWTVRGGEHWVMLGANGSGKSSLLAAICGYLMPSDGEMTLLGERYGETDWRELKCKVGLVSSIISTQIEPAETAQSIVLSGRYGMVNFWGKVEAGAGEKATQKLTELGLEHLAARPWQQLSQGERQRVLIARALMSGCRVLFLDEPCAGLDPVARASFLAFLAGIASSRREFPRMVLVTHHVEEIVEGFTHALVLGKGCVLGSGKVTDALASETLTAAFGAPVTLRGKAGSYTLSVP